MKEEEEEDSPKDLQGYLDPRGAAKHGRMPRER